MQIIRNGSQPSARGSAEWFTGAVRVDPLFQAPEPARVRCASVTFEPGARTAWHTHPLGQTLIVTAGRGRVQRWGGPVEEIRAGDVMSGKYFYHQQERAYNPQAGDVPLQERFLDICETLTGVPLPA